MADYDPKSIPILDDVIKRKTDNIESALIDYEQKKTENNPAADKQPVPPPPQPLITPINVQAITHNIVEQLMPELEQRLRILVEQALTERLPSDIIQFTPTSDTKIDD